MRRRGIDVSTTSDEGLQGVSDEMQLAHSHALGRVIVTRDIDFLRLHHDGQPHSGIAYCRQRGRSIGEMLRGLVLIWECLAPEEMRGHVEFL